jgi:probable HAF family extracellular repeat protein
MNPMIEFKATILSNAEQSNLANNHSQSERSQIMRQMTMFAQRVCSMLGGAFFVGAFVLTLVAIPSGASAFTFTTIDVPGATFTGASGINDHGQIVGFYDDVSGTEHGFLLDRGIFTTIDVPGATSTHALGINAHAQIVGLFTDAGGTVHGFRAQ